MAKLTEKEKKARAKKRDKNNRADLKIMQLSPNYKPGKDKALDAAIQAIMKDPEMRGSWGIKGSTNKIGPVRL
tara:strand:- start:12 stop:230 length:219 start_codon:yes stop_codon:yes gene_type:complete